MQKQMQKEQGFILPIIIAVAVVVVLGASGYFVYKQYSAPKQNPAPKPTACTQEAKLCPDGSSVGRTGPNCEFTTCPGQALSLVYSNDKKYSAFIETIEESNLVISKIHVKNQQTSEDKIIKIESCCIDGVGCGLCPFPCQIKNFSLNNKYVVIDCGTSPQRTVKVINIDTKKEISFSSAIGYSWLNNEEIKFTNVENYEFNGSIIDCRINVNSGVETCDTQFTGWKTYNGNGFSFKYPNNLMIGEELGRPTLTHQVVFTHPNPCNWKDGASIPNLIDFKIIIELVDKDVQSALSSAEGLSGEKKINIGSLNGYKYTWGVEMCGNDYYYLSVAPQKTLIIKSPIVTELTNIISEEERQNYLKIPGIINSKQAENLLANILSTFKFTE